MENEVEACVRFVCYEEQSGSICEVCVRWRVEWKRACEWFHMDVAAIKWTEEGRVRWRGD